MKQNRRKFLRNSLQASLGLYLGHGFFNQNIWAQHIIKNEKIKISLQCFSFASSLLNGEMSILEFPELVRDEFNLDGAEYWNIPLIQKRKDPVFIKEIQKKTADYGLENTLMLVDLIDLKSGKSLSLCSQDPKERDLSIEGHKEWMDVAKSIGCNAVRVNLWSEGMTAAEVRTISVESLGKLLEYGSAIDMSVVIENHGGFTSDAKWLIQLIKTINHPNLGTLPDFGTNNFCIERAIKKEGQIYNTSPCINQYDKYKGVEEMLPYAKGISAKSIGFNEKGDEVNTDFERMMNLIKAASFEGYIAIEYEGAFMAMMGKDSGNHLSSREGVLATKKLIEKFL